MADDDLVDEKGNTPSDDFRELRTRKGWARKKAEDDAAQEEKTMEGTKGRSVGEHVLAGARAVFEGGKFRAGQSKGRDPVNPLYDRRRATPKYPDDDEKPKKPVLYDRDE